MNITTDMVKQLREMTGAGILDCKKTLEATNGDMEKAAAILYKKGLAQAAKKADREAKDGVIGVYVHNTQKLVGLVELNCETDFVSRLDEFRALARDLAMQVAGYHPLYLRVEDIPEEVLLAQRQLIRAELADSSKSEGEKGLLVESRLKKWFEEVVLLEQHFFRDENKTVRDVLNEAIAKFGENVVLRRFVRFELGE
ncbi:MAG: elongation factor Ts [Chloroflexi bacterium]|nr:elongation factor Ts [Chloroflexota bacterium]